MRNVALDLTNRALCDGSFPMAAYECAVTANQLTDALDGQQHGQTGTRTVKMPNQRQKLLPGAEVSLGGSLRPCLLQPVRTTRRIAPGDTRGEFEDFFSFKGWSASTAILG